MFVITPVCCFTVCFLKFISPEPCVELRYPAFCESTAWWSFNVPYSLLRQLPPALLLPVG
jgi:hypothetical protein